MVLSMMSGSYAGTRALQSTSKSNLNRTVSQKSPRGCESTMLRNPCQQLGPRTELSSDTGTTTRGLERPRDTQQTQAGAPRVPVCLRGQWDTVKARIPLISAALEDITTVSCSQSTGKQRSSCRSQEKRHEGSESPSQISGCTWRNLKSMDILRLARVAWNLLRIQGFALCTVTFYLKVALWERKV